MKMSGGVTGCCVALLLVLTGVSAVQKLNSISDLKKINFGPSVPKHSLILLHWFANVVTIDNNNVMWLNFDPQNDYGSHHYGNYDGLLEPLPRGHQYFTVGNLNEDTSEELPDYVVYPPRDYAGRNMDRIIIRVRRGNSGQQVSQMIDRVYITQHYDTSENQGTPYDPDHTYQITTRLIRTIREFSVRDNQQPLLYLTNRYGSNADNSHIRNTWGQLACLGLLLFIVIQEKHRPVNQRDNRPGNSNRQEHRTPVKTHRPEHRTPVRTHRPEHRTPVNIYREQRNNRPRNNKSWNNEIKIEIESGPENRRCCCSRRTLVMVCVSMLIFVFLIIFMSIYLRQVFQNDV